VKQVSQRFKDGCVEVKEVPQPALRPQGVLVRTAYSLISAGTERAKVDLGQKSLLGKARSRPDQVQQVLQKVRRDGLLQTYHTVHERLEESSPIGYSLAGAVTAVGELVEGIKVGERVACGGAEYANHAEMVYVPQNLAVVVPEGVALDDAAYCTVGAIAMQGVRQAGVSVGDRVAVIGLGLVGQITCQILRAAGCAVAGIDLAERKCALAASLGAHKTLAGSGEVARGAVEFAGGVGFDAVIITAGTKSSEPVELAGEIARDRGTVVVVGDVGLSVPRKSYYEKELSLRLARSYGPGRYDPLYEEQGIDYPVGYVRWTERANMQEFLRLISAGSVDVRSLTTHRFAIDDAAKAYDCVQAGANELTVGVLLEYADRPLEKGRIAVGERRERAAVAGERVGIGLIGAGNFATATLLPALKGDARVDLRGVVTASGLSARDVAERQGFAYCAGDAGELLADDSVGAVIIATRHDSHAQLATQALAAGKTVFVEKPLALTEEELESVVAAQLSSGGDLMVGFNRRFSPLTQAVVADLKGRSGPLVVNIRVNAGSVPATHWTQQLEQGGGRIVGEMCHFVDLASCLVGAPVGEVYAASAGKRSSAALADTLSATLRFADGSVATVVYAANGDVSLPKERIEVFCEGRAWVIDDFRTLTAHVGGKTSRTRLRRADKGHAAEMQAFVALSLGTPSTVLTFEHCVASTAATFKIIESLTTGLPVALAASSAKAGPDLEP
jgi:predicted dehydrogenase/threonine dehydrogenase-like Zn-dependent dehydrogenase